MYYNNSILYFIGSLIVYFVLGIIWGAVSSSIVKGKGYPDSENHGFAWGFWLGLIGLIVCASKVPYSMVNKSVTNHNMADTKTNVSNADLLLKYKQLLDAGAITQEEYEIKKKELL